MNNQEGKTMRKLLLIALMLFTSADAETTKTITISNCLKFLDAPEKCEEFFVKAAKKAKIPGFILYDSISVSGVHYKYFVNHVGYLSIMINQFENKLYLDFYCSDDSFDYNKFISCFLKVCYASEKPHIPTVIIENTSTGAYEIIQDEDFFDKLTNGDTDCLENL